MKKIVRNYQKYRMENISPSSTDRRVASENQKEKWTCVLIYFQHRCVARIFFQGRRVRTG